MIFIEPFRVALRKTTKKQGPTAQVIRDSGRFNVGPVSLETAMNTKRGSQDPVKKKIWCEKWRKNNLAKVRAISRAQRERNRERYRLRKRVSARVAYAKKRGYISVPERCERCGKVARLYGHHADYTKPLQVEWVCSLCHRHTYDNTKIEAEN